MSDTAIKAPPYIAITANYSKIRKVRRRLRRKGLTVYVPAIVTRRPIAKGSRLKYRRRITVLMTYILVKAPDHSAVFDLWLYDILSTKDVRGYLKNNSQAATIPDSAVEDIKTTVAKLVSQMRTVNHKRWLREGAKASIKDGSLAGKTGKVQWVRKNRAGLEAMLFGSMRVVEVDAKNLEAA
jgi:transcription antitermination factor NusG